MRLKYFWMANTTCMALAVGIVVASYLNLIDERSSLISLGVLLGPMLITAYHFGFIVPQMRDLLHSHIELRNVRNELIQEREQRRKELERSQTLLRNLTAPTRSKVRKDVTGRFIYLIADEDRTAVKIGISHDPGKRLIALQTANNRRLEILAVFEGTEADEQRIHDRFASDRLNGEWFRMSPDVSAFIAAVREQSA